MPRIEFYVLPSAQAEARLRAACQLAAKGWRHGMTVFVRCADEAQLEAVDDLLWRFKPEAFVPHARIDGGGTAPVVLGFDEAPPQDQGLLVNLEIRPSAHLDRFARVIEIVNQEPALLTACRDNFRLYRQRGYDPQRVEL